MSLFTYDFLKCKFNGHYIYPFTGQVFKANSAIIFVTKPILIFDINEYLL